jgi:hypothetical protein
MKIKFLENWLLCRSIDCITILIGFIVSRLIAMTTTKSLLSLYYFTIFSHLSKPPTITIFLKRLITMNVIQTDNEFDVS